MSESEAEYARATENPPEFDKVLACPTCGNERVGSNDTVAAIAQGAWVLQSDGSRTFQPGGYTDVIWDSQMEDGEHPAYCRGCGSEWRLDQLVVPLDPELLAPAEALAVIERGYAGMDRGPGALRVLYDAEDLQLAVKSLRAHLDITTTGGST